MSDAELRSAVHTGADRREERRSAILDAAEELFLSQGFDRVSLAAIVKRSGGSLATLYELFGNKLGLLRAMISRAIQQSFDDMLSIEADVPPSVQLREMALRMCSHMLDPGIVGLKRIVIGESLRDPLFARSFHEQVHQPRITLLAEAFRVWTEQGKAAIDRPLAAANLYFAIVMTDVHEDALMGTSCLGNTACDEDSLDWRLAMFFSHFKMA